MRRETLTGVTAVVTEADRDRFWSRVDIETIPDGCWPWTGSLNAEGRGRITIGGRTDYAYRWSLRLSGVDIPEGAVVRHTCGNPSCVRHDHLAVGDQRENNLDAIDHGRNQLAKLNAHAVRRMRERHAADRTPVRELAAEHGVSPSAVSAALTGNTWPRAGGPIRRSRKRSP